jgi:hypothetical protein
MLQLGERSPEVLEHRPIEVLDFTGRRHHGDEAEIVSTMR